MRIFAYCRVSTTEQTTENQVLAISRAGYDIRSNRVVSETISGGVKAMERPEFIRLVDRLEEGDSLVVLKLDRLGRDAIDIQQTVQMFVDMGVKLVCLDLPVSDLSSAEGRLMLQMFGAFAEFERNRIKERTVLGLERAKAEGKKLGRPPAMETNRRVQQAKAQGLGQSETARTLGIGLSTVKRHWKNVL
ncbi:TPA: recombinase family protein [Vibrio parahaemolyticus]|uniref:recombinase family protein n=1 Tax=Vibrio parahaemolyticus TaxID=670 RepID=UPI0017820AAD|nr:recombinase family protein [Vibrio parahaemolyticus]EGQ7783900.1 recombinase family protein [Vibrio parahaemolyticus]EIA1496690.1 recombinase family protein [Vibrio parahaemolyticus]EJG0961246.1 recombinase family protein [Vibrio parahaemolyticus]ELJ8865315.1 recombinase family protein [Vibrio parahaemolyticus]MBD6966549.1 recombinase family protein [Vibrio parahaemolyticus]